MRDPIETTKEEYVVISNGSKWGGSAPDGLEDLLRVLEKYTLDPVFEDYGNFFSYVDEVYRGKENKHGRRVLTLEKVKTPYWSFGGNFFDLSHVFDIDFKSKDHPDAVRLLAAIRKNQSSDKYKEAKEELAA